MTKFPDRPNLDLVVSFLDDSCPETALANKVNPNPRVKMFCMDECEFIRVFLIVSIWWMVYGVYENDRHVSLAKPDSGLDPKIRLLMQTRSPRL